MSDWKTYKIKDLYSEPSRNGLTKPSAIRGSGSKMVNMKEIFAYDRMVNIPMERVPLTEKEERFILKSGDLLFARQSLVVSGAGKCSIFLHDDEEVVFESHLIRTRFKDKFVFPSFLYYYFRSPIGRNKIESIVEFTAAAGIRGSDLSNIEIEIPDVVTQKELAEILITLDDKIELNLQMNQTLEAMAQAIFKEWFVNFNFPGFDGELENGLPKGWRMGSLNEIICFVVDNRGKTPNTLIEKENNYPLIEVNSLINSQVITQQHLAKKYVDDETYNNWFRKGHPQKGDVLFSTVGSIGEISLVFDEKICIAQNIIALRSIFNGSFLFFTLKNLKQSLLSLDISSVQPSIKVPHLLKSEILIPTKEIIKAYEESILPIIEKINENSIQIQTLTQSRDTLLPKLMSGKIEIKN